jgi:hypothetical protein
LDSEVGMRGMKAVVGVAILGCALWAGTSAFGAHATTKPPPPAAGRWTMTATALYPEVKSGSLTVKGQTVTGLHGTMKVSQGCPGGSFKVTGGVPIIEANLGHGHEQWEVASGGSAVGGGALQPTSIALTVGHTREVNATMEIAFPAPGEKSLGAIGWGDDGTGSQDCLIEFTVTAK